MVSPRSSLYLFNFSSKSLPSEINDASLLLYYSSKESGTLARFGDSSLDSYFFNKVLLFLKGLKIIEIFLESKISKTDALRV